LLEQEDLLSQLARRIPGPYLDNSCHVGPLDSLYFGLDPFSEHHKMHALTNTAICDRSQPNEIVTRRFSIGLSGLSAHNDLSMFDPKEYSVANDKSLHSMRDISNEKWFSYQGPDKISAFDCKSSAVYESKATTLSPMKVSTNFFDEVRVPATRRSSMDSVESFASDSVCDEEEEVMQAGGDDDDDDDDDDYDVEDQEEYSDYVDDGHMQVGASNPALANEPDFVAFSFNAGQRRVHFQIDPAAAALPVTPLLLQSPSSSPLQVKGAIDSFTESMTASMRSQQAIHDWDRKMGLKRSHSKTMRLSMRSRKRLKIMLEKELGIVSSTKY
jgi:hypothetical protein